ncbi:hypothetical protein FFF34_009430 [Inquilinus sp. KBS0705]|nr:hypothetical protein FFF34_009430 [Inquilinus sp. KBS0705]
MKSKYLLFICLLALGFAACKKEDSYPKKIIGKWRIKEIRRQVFDTTGVKISDTVVIAGASAGNYFLFNADGTGEKHPADGIGAAKNDFTYKIEGNNLNLMLHTTESGTPYEDTYIILKLSSAEMTLSHGEDYINPKRHWVVDVTWKK